MLIELTLSCRIAVRICLNVMVLFAITMLYVDLLFLLFIEKFSYASRARLSSNLRHRIQMTTLVRNVYFMYFLQKELPM